MKKKKSIVIIFLLALHSLMLSTNGGIHLWSIRAASHWRMGKDGVSKWNCINQWTYGKSSCISISTITKKKKKMKSMIILKLLKVSLILLVEYSPLSWEFWNYDVSLAGTSSIIGFTTFFGAVNFVLRKMV